VDKSLVMKSSLSTSSVLDMKLDNVSLCVVPATNRDEIEIQFHEAETLDRDEDSLVQITFHFPPGEDPEEDSTAEAFQKAIMGTGVIRSVTGSIIAEFSKEQGNFVTPRGKYAIQVS
jgi:Structure-specific recognition protein (SSRP1)